MNYSKDFTRSQAGRNTMTDRDYAHVGRAYCRWRDRKGFKQILTEAFGQMHWMVWWM